MAKKNLPYPAEKIGELLIEVDNEVAKKSDLNDFVKKESGRGLSTNDYTTAEKNKLAGIQEGAQKNTVTSVRGALQLNPQVGNVVISAADIGLGNANTRLTSLENNKLDKSEKGATNGVASLDENGRVPSSQLPSYVDDVIDDLNFAQFPATGESGKIYIAKDTNKTYRWSGNGYAEVSASLALGETEQTAYSGANGKKNAEDIAKLAKDLDETHLLASNAESAISEVVELTIPAIGSELENKLGKTEKAADSAKADSASALMPKSTTVTSVTNTSLTYHLVLADDTGSLPRGDNANALITIPTLAGNLKYLHQLGFTGKGLFHRKFYNKDVDTTTAWSQIAFTDSTVANANSATTSSSLTVNGITSDVTYGTTAGIIQNTADNPTGYWWNKLRILHNNSAGYFTELAMPFVAASGLYYRSKNGSEVSEWHKIPFASEIPSLSLQGKTGAMLYPEPNALTAGWYRIGVTTRTSQQGWTFRMMLRRGFNYDAGETYIIDVAIGYGGTNNVYFTQVAGGINNSRLIDKVRVTIASNSKSYIDLHIATDCKNNIAYFFDGDAEAYASGAIVTGETATTYEFTTVNGMASSHNITAPKFIGALQGNADSATNLATPRIIWGQSFDGSGDITGALALPTNGVVWYAASSKGLQSAFLGASRNIHGSAFIGINATLTDEHSLSMASAHANIGTSGIMMFGNNGVYKNSILLTTHPVGASGETFNPLLFARVCIREDGNVGIGTTNPTEKLDVAGNIKASGNVISKGLRVEGDVVITGNVVIEGSVTSGASYQSNSLSTISEDEVPSVEQQLRAQIATLEQRIAALEQLIAQNNG